MGYVSLPPVSGYLLFQVPWEHFSTLAAAIHRSTIITSSSELVCNKVQGMTFQEIQSRSRIQTCYKNHHHHHHHRFYSPGWALASSSKCCRDPYPGQPQTNFLVSSSTPSIHLDFGRPHPHWPPGFVHDIFLGNSVSSIRTTWPPHLSLLYFIILIIFGSL